ncbi:MAG: MBL fold metallo-hydrolase [Coriobacteriales bacterium]|jgi:glyoxylase-like metal-dependent hydrolase (beta-lactamase superfamily II)|nr:MBL fold metallo-hydrolase [Coriobacteriales bacterium]
MSIMQVFRSDLLEVMQVGSPGGEGFLARTAERSLLYDCGFAYSAPALVAQLEDLLEQKPLDFLFLSHSHYDHASASAWIKERWPDVIVLGSAHAARVLERPGARETMLSLNLEATREACEAGRISAAERDSFDYSLLNTLSVDQIVAEGDRIDLGSVQLEVLAAPGHTRCSLMLWLAQDRLLFGTETFGIILDDNTVAPAILTGHHDALASIKKAQALHPEHILVSHQLVVSGPTATRYLENALYWSQKVAHFVWECQSMSLAVDEVVEVLKQGYAKYEKSVEQPEAAFDLNNRLLVELLFKTPPEPPAPGIAGMRNSE